VGANGLERHTDGFTQGKAMGHAKVSPVISTHGTGGCFKGKEADQRSDISDQEATRRVRSFKL